MQNSPKKFSYWLKTPNLIYSIKHKGGLKAHPFLIFLKVSRNRHLLSDDVCLSLSEKLKLAILKLDGFT